MPFAANIGVEQGVTVANIMIAFCFIYTSADVCQHTFNRSRVATLRYSKTATLEVGLHNLSAYTTCVLPNS